MSQVQDTSIKGLLMRARTDAQRLLQAQIELAKLEMQQTGRAVGKTGALAIAGAALGGLAGVFLLVTIAYVLVEVGLPVWAGFGIVTLALFVITVILLLLARSSARKIKAPSLAIAEVEKTRDALSG